MSSPGQNSDIILKLYLDLLKKSLTNTIFNQEPLATTYQLRKTMKVPYTKASELLTASLTYFSVSV